MSGIDPDEIIDPLVCPTCGGDAAKLRILAEILDAWDDQRQVVYGKEPETEAQDDLRAWAQCIEELS